MRIIFIAASSTGNVRQPEAGDFFSGLDAVVLHFQYSDSDDLFENLRETTTQNTFFGYRHSRAIQFPRTNFCPFPICCKGWPPKVSVLCTLAEIS